MLSTLQHYHCCESALRRNWFKQTCNVFKNSAISDCIWYWEPAKMEAICPVNACSLNIPGSFTGASRMLHGCFTGASRVFHGCFTGVSRVAHGTKPVFQVSNPVFWVSNTLVSRVVHGWFTVDSRVIHGGSRVVHGWFTGVSRLVSGCWRTSFTGLWAAVKGDSKQWNWYQEPWNSTKWGNGLQLFSQWFVAKTQLCTASTELWQKLTQVKYVL